MSDKYAVATAVQGKIVDCTWGKYWSSKSYIFYSMWLASKADGVRTVDELYKLYGIDEPYSERREIIKDIFNMCDECIVVDLDDRNIYFNCSSRYSAANYRDRETVDMSAVRRLAETDNAYDWDDYYGDGSACCGGKRMPFDCFNHELLVEYCEEYYGWTMPSHRAEDDTSAEADHGIKKEVLQWYNGLDIPMDVLKEYGEKWLSDWLLLIEEEKQSMGDIKFALYTDEEGENVEWVADEELEDEELENYKYWSFVAYVREKERQLHKPSWLISWENNRNEMAKATEEDK